jgi:hypothetical protein
VAGTIWRQAASFGQDQQVRASSRTAAGSCGEFTYVLEETMKNRKRLFTFFLIAVALLLLVACATQAPSGERYNAPATEAATEAAAEFGYNDAANAPAPMATAAPLAKTDQDSTGAVYEIGSDSTTVGTSPRMIIKNAEMRLQVRDTDVAIDGVTQVVGDAQGYIISSRVWYQDSYGKNYKYASITMGVPVTEFETALRRLRGLSLNVLDETASGQDVSQEYVDLQSQLTNLEATRDRIRSFLDDAKTVDESLRINQELSNIEAQIEQVKGRMNFLADRSAYSTITVQLEPQITDPTPTATLTATPTATPLPWNPGKTYDQAKKSVTRTYQGFAEFAIWLVIAVLPVLAPPVLVLWGIFALIKRALRQPPKG